MVNTMMYVGPNAALETDQFIEHLLFIFPLDTVQISALLDKGKYSQDKVKTAYWFSL